MSDNNAARWQRCWWATDLRCYMSEWVRLGEIGAARRSLERSGEMVSELAQTHRDFIDKIQRTAAQEGSPPSDVPN